MLGIRLRVSREKSGYSRRDLSERTGIDQTTIYKIETDKIKDPKINTIEKLADALDVNVFYLLGASEDPAKKLLKSERVTVAKPPQIDQIKKTLEHFEEIKHRTTLHKTKAPKVRPFYPIYIDIPLDGHEIIFKEIPRRNILGHIDIEYGEQVDYILTVNGNQMSPYVEDGGLALIRRYEPGLLRDEDIGVFFLVKQKISVMRQVFYHRIGDLMYVGLRSYNPRKTTWYHHDESVISFQGKVVGTENDPDEVKRLLSNIEKEVSEIMADRKG